MSLKTPRALRLVRGVTNDNQISLIRLWILLTYRAFLPVRDPLDGLSPVNGGGSAGW
jgi:hypothetical protein